MPQGMPSKYRSRNIHSFPTIRKYRRFPSSKQLKQRDNGEYYVIDYTPGVVTTSVTPGSIVKGASMLVGYKYGVIKIGQYHTDECIKIKATPEKCSWKCRTVSLKV